MIASCLASSKPILYVISGPVRRLISMRDEKRKGSWKDALKFAVCAALLGAAWLLWQRHLGPELREALANPQKSFMVAPRD